jgi:hypothetical protein
MPTDKDVVYSEARSGRWPPYLINFQNAVGERHAENLKVPPGRRQACCASADAFLSLG